MEENLKPSLHCLYKGVPVYSLDDEFYVYYERIYGFVQIHTTSSPVAFYSSCSLKTIRTFVTKSLGKSLERPELKFKFISYEQYIRKHQTFLQTIKNKKIMNENENKKQSVSFDRQSEFYYYGQTLQTLRQLVDAANRNSNPSTEFKEIVTNLSTCFNEIVSLIKTTSHEICNL